MPLPKCSPKEVYDKKSKKCIVIGSDAYKAIVKNNPSAFKHYASKIAKATKAPPKCSVTQVYNKNTGKCVNIGSQAYREALKKDPTVFNNQISKINALLGPKKVNSPNETLANIMKKKTPSPYQLPPHLEKMLVGKCTKPDEVYSKLSKRCVKIGGQAYKQALKKNSTVFDSQKQKIMTFKPKTPKTSVKKMNLVKPKTPTKPKTPEGLKKLLLKRQPVPKVSAKTRALFMKKIVRHLKTKKPVIPNTSNLTKIPNDVFIKKTTEIKLYHYDYFNSNEIFKKHKTRKREMLELKISRDNVYDYFYKHVLKMNMNPDIIDRKWFVDMQKYIASLTDRERYALYSYTQYGDVYVNLMERGLPIDFSRVRMDPLVYEIVSTTTDAGFYDALNDTGAKIMASKTPISFDAMRKDKSGKLMQDFKNIIVYELGSEHFKKEYLRSMIKSLSTTLHNVFDFAPVTTKPMVVYRGVKDSFFTADEYNKPMKKDEVFVNKGFVSTSLLHSVPMRDFMGDGGCCFKTITILPGTKCIPLVGLTHFRNEVEFLLDKNTKYIIRDKYTTVSPSKLLDFHGNYHQTKKIKVSDIIIG